MISMTEQIPSTKLVLDIDRVMATLGLQSAYALAQRSGISMPTIYRYKNHAKGIKNFDAAIVYRLAAEIAKARGVTVQDVKLGELFIELPDE
jgi:hypothetical protein